MQQEAKHAFNFDHLFDQSQENETDLEVFLRHRQQQKSGRDLLGITQLFKKVAYPGTAAPEPEWKSDTEVHLKVDADGDQTNDELELRFKRTGNQVSLTVFYIPPEATKDTTKESKTFVLPLKTSPELFNIWNQIPSIGGEPYTIYLSLDSNSRAFLGEYENLPAHLTRKFIAGIKKEDSAFSNEFLSTEGKVMGSPEYNNTTIHTPWNIASESGQDVLKISHEQYSVGIVYTISYNGKPLEGEIFAKNMASSQPLLKKEHNSKRKKEEKEFGTFVIPIKAGRKQNISQHYYELLIIPGDRKGTANVSVSLTDNDPDDQFSWPGTIEVEVPVTEVQKMTYKVFPYANHTNIVFFEPDKTPNKNKPQIRLHFQAFRDRDQDTELLKVHRTEALHLHYQNKQRGEGWHKETYTTYYKKGERQGKKVIPNDKVYAQQVIQDARKRPPKTFKATKLPQVKNDLILAEKSHMRNIWHRKGQSLPMNYKRGDVKKLAAKKFDEYLLTVIALRRIQPLIGSKVLPQKSFELLRVRNTAAIVEEFERWVTEAIKVLPKADQAHFLGVKPLLSDLLYATDNNTFGQIRLEQTLKAYQETMLALTKYMLKETIKPNENVIVKEHKRKGIDEMGNRHKNFLKFEKKMGLKDNEKLMKVKAYFYPKKDWYTKVKSKADSTVQGFMEGNAMPRMELPLYVYRKGDYWHIVSFFHRTMGIYFHPEPVKLKNEKERTEYATNPPVELFERLNHSDHLPKGWIIYDLPGKGNAKPIKTTSSWTADQVLGWVSMALLAVGVVAFTFGAGALAGAALLGATVTSGLGAAIAWNRRENNGMITNRQRWLYFLDVASAIVGSAGSITNMVSKAAKVTGIAGKIGGFTQLALSTADVAIDATILLSVAPDAYNQIRDIALGPGSTKEKEIALGKLLPLLALQYGLFVVTLPKRVKNPKKLKAHLEQLQENFGRQGGGTGSGQLNLNNIPQLKALKQKGWDEEALEKLYQEVGHNRFMKKVARLATISPDELTRLKQIYPEESLLFSLYTHGNIHKARVHLDAHFGYKNSSSMLRKIDAGKKARSPKAPDNTDLKTKQEAELKANNARKANESYMAKQEDIIQQKTSEINTAKGKVKQASEDLQNSKDAQTANQQELLLKEQQIKHFPQGKPLLKDKSPEALALDIKSWEDQLDKLNEALPAKKKELGMKKDAIAQYKKGLNDAYEANNKKVEEFKTKSIKSANRTHTNRLRKNPKGRALRRVIRDYKDKRKRIDEEYKKKKWLRFKFNKRNYAENLLLIKQREQGIGKLNRSIERYEYLIGELKTRIKDGNKMLKLHQEVQGLKQQKAGLQIDVTLKTYQQTKAKHQLSNAQNNLNEAQNKLNKAWKDKPSLDADHQTKRKARQQAQDQYNKAQQKYQQDLVRYKKNKQVGQLTKQRAQSQRLLYKAIDQRYQLYQKLVMKLQKMTEKLAENARVLTEKTKKLADYNKANHLDALKAGWTMAKTLAAMIPAGSPIAPELRTTVAELKAYIKNIHEYLWKLMVMHHGLRTQKDLKALISTNPAKALSMVRSQLDRIRANPQKIDMTELSSVVGQLETIERTIIQQRQVLKTKLKK